MCTREQRLAWYVQDDVWGAVMAGEYYDKTVCLECFLKRAGERNYPVLKDDVKVTGVITR